VWRSWLERVGSLGGSARASTWSAAFDCFSLLIPHTYPPPQVWSAETLTCTKVLEGHNEAVLALAVGDLFMASGSYDTTIR